MNPSAALDQYCERLHAGLWAEPLNAFSNMAFFLAAWLLWRRSEISGDRALAVLVALVGAGSLTFHLYATVWAKWLDVLFIEAFIYAYVASYARRMFALRWARVVAVLAGFAVFEWAFVRAFPPGAFNGSYIYFPAFLAIVLMSALAWRRSPPVARLLGLATGIFLAAIILRSVDMAWCETLPWGTHFIWHMLNAAVLYCSVRGLHRRGV
jgi:hypothetical protein